MNNFETPLAITMGDPSGIGPEIILKSVVETKLNNFLIFGDSLVFDSLIKSLGLPLTINKISKLFLKSISILFPKIFINKNKINERVIENIN